MAATNSWVTIHMAASLDGFIARRTAAPTGWKPKDEFEAGATLTPEYIEEFLKAIDWLLSWARAPTETALGFEAKGFGWAYGDKPTFVLTSRDLPKKPSVEFYSGDLAGLFGRLRQRHGNIWVAGGGMLAGELCGSTWPTKWRFRSCRC